MKKLSILIMMLLMLSGCSASAGEAEKLAIAEARVTNLEEQVSDLAKKLAEAESHVDEAEARAAEAEFELFSTISAGFSDPAEYNQNIVVKRPEKNRVTFEIDERLVGRYVVEDDPEMYFEIKPDGKAEISLNALEGYAKYGSEIIQLTAYYSDYRVYINFNLVSGKWTFPASSGLSVTFRDDYNNFNSFESTTYWPEDHMQFVKQNKNGD